MILGDDIVKRFFFFDKEVFALSYFTSFNVFCCFTFPIHGGTIVGALFFILEIVINQKRGILLLFKSS